MSAAEMGGWTDGAAPLTSTLVDGLVFDGGRTTCGERETDLVFDGGRTNFGERETGLL